MKSTIQPQRGGNLPSSHIESLHAIEDKYWWFEGRVNWVCHLIGRWAKCIDSHAGIYADLGCGTGAFAQRLASTFSFDEVILADRDPALLQSAQRFKNMPICPKIRVCSIDLGSSFVLSVAPDIITCLDVVEHIEGDQEFITRIAKALAPNGLVVLSAPAHPVLFSPWDEELVTTDDTRHPASGSFFTMQGSRWLTYVICGHSFFPPPLAVS